MEMLVFDRLSDHIDMSCNTKWLGQEKYLLTDRLLYCSCREPDTNLSKCLMPFGNTHWVIGYIWQSTCFAQKGRLRWFALAQHKQTDLSRTVLLKETGFSYLPQQIHYFILYRPMFLELSLRRHIFNVCRRRHLWWNLQQIQMWKRLDWYRPSNSRQRFSFAMLLITSRLSFSYSLILSSSSPTIWQQTAIAVWSLPFVPPWATFRTPLSLPFVPPYRYLSYPPLW